MSYRLTNGEDQYLRDAVKRKIGVVCKSLSDPADFRGFVTRADTIYSISGDGPLVSFARVLLPQSKINVSLTRNGVEVQDFGGAGYPIAQLDLPGWVRRFNDRWWEIRDASITGYPPELDDDQYMHAESVLETLSGLGA